MTAVKWESNDTSHRATLRSAGEFSTESYRRKSVTKGVEMILGKHESNDGVLKVQSLVFDKEHFETQADAKKWMSENLTDTDKEYDSRSGKPLDSKGISEVGISKRITMLQSAGGASGGISKDAGVSSPDASQLALINTFTRSPKTADEVAIFPVLACNDIIDRDTDQFTAETVSGFMELAGPLSPIGKSFMVGHDYRSLPVGRIFDGAAEKIEGVNWLKLWTYMPNTEQYKSYLENVDFGIYWAVSVGVMLGGATCSVGAEHEWGWHPYVCSQGHMKGERYAASDAVGSVYDMAEPTEDGALCWRKLQDPQDFYELSQVYLGAQYYAAYSDKVAGAVSKSFEQGGPDMAAGLALYESDAKILSLTAEEAAQLPQLYPADSKIAAAHDEGIEIKELDDGSRQWTDSEGLVWEFSVEGEELCLGKAADDEDEEDDVETEEEDDESEEEEDDTDDKDPTAEDATDKLLVVTRAVELVVAKAAAGDDDEGMEQALVTGIDTAVDLGIAALGAGDNAAAVGYFCAAYDLLGQEYGALLDDVEQEVMGGAPEEEPTLDNLSEPNTEVTEVKTKAEVLRAVRAAKLPSEYIEAVASAEDVQKAIDAVLGMSSDRIAELSKSVLELTPKAALGDSYLKTLRTDALHWYTMANKQPDSDKGVDVAQFEKMLDLCGDNEELLKAQGETYRDLARAKFPEAVRRSTHPNAGVNDRGEVAASPTLTASGSAAVKRIHN